jgi:hypothetical protein
VKSGDHLENNLAKLGYIIDIKVEKKPTRKQNPSIIYVLGYILELIIKI